MVSLSCLDTEITHSMLRGSDNQNYKWFFFYTFKNERTQKQVWCNSRQTPLEWPLPKIARLIDTLQIQSKDWLPTSYLFYIYIYICMYACGSTLENGDLWV